MKDEEGATIQHISLYKVDALLDKINSFNHQYTNKNAFITLTFLKYSHKPCSIGNLIGNAFKIRIRDLNKQTAIFYLINISC